MIQFKKLYNNMIFRKKGFDSNQVFSQINYLLVYLYYLFYIGWKYTYMYMYECVVHTCKYMK